MTERPDFPDEMRAEDVFLPIVTLILELLVF